MTRRLVIVCTITGLVISAGSARYFRNMTIPSVALSTGLTAGILGLIIWAMDKRSMFNKD